MAPWGSGLDVAHERADARGALDRVAVAVALGFLERVVRVADALREQRLAATGDVVGELERGVDGRVDVAKRAAATPLDVDGLRQPLVGDELGLHAARERVERVAPHARGDVE